MKNILITSVSSKTALIDTLRENLQSISNEILIIGVDSNQECIAKYFVDIFYQIDVLENLSISEFINKCIEWSILLIIPTRDEDVFFFSKHLTTLESYGIRVMVSRFDSVVICNDKYLFFQHTKQYNSIPSALDINHLKAKNYVVKERFGSGSKLMGINLTKSEASRFALSINNPLFQSYIVGSEISIDAYVDKNGNVKGIVLRQRNLIIDGESKVTTTIINENIEKVSIEIIKHLNLYGHVMLQMFITPQNEFFLIECNPRFGGASTLSIKAGLESFKWAYLEALNLDISSMSCQISNLPIMQIRASSNFYK